jgi:hypothetical protein
MYTMRMLSFPSWRAWVAGVAVLLLVIMVVPAVQAQGGGAQGSLNKGIQDVKTKLGEGGLKDIKVSQAIISVIQFMLGLVALLALGALVWGGIKYIISLGDEKKMASAKNIILAAIIGVLIAGFSLTILTTIKDQIFK